MGSRPARAPTCHELGQNQHFSPWQTLGQKNILGEYPWGMFLWCFFFPQHNPSCSFRTISRDAHRTFCTPGRAASCTPRRPPLHRCLPAVPPAMHTPKRQVTSLPSLGASLHNLFLLLGQLREVKTSVLTCSISWGAAPSLAPSTSPHSRRGAGIRTALARWLTRSLPLPCQGFFLCRTDGHKLFGNHRPSRPRTPRKDASPLQGAIPSRLRHRTLFRGAGKSLTRLSFSGGGRAAFHSHDKLLLSKLHECSY